MRTEQNVRRIRMNAEEFGIAPELAWLMQAQPLWDEVKRTCTLLNRGQNAEEIAAVDPPIDRLRHELLTLQSILEGRK